LDCKAEASKAQRRPLPIRVSTLRAITKADVHLELMRDRKRTRRWQAISRPAAGGWALPDLVN